MLLPRIAFGRSEPREPAAVPLEALDPTLRFSQPPLSTPTLRKTNGAGPILAGPKRNSGRLPDTFIWNGVSPRVSHQQGPL